MWQGLALRGIVLLAVFVAGYFAGEARCAQRAKKDVADEAAKSNDAVQESDAIQLEEGKIARAVIDETKAFIDQAVGERPSEAHGSNCWTKRDSIELRTFYAQLYPDQVSSGPELDGGQ